MAFEATLHMKKICRKCKESKSLSDFYNDSRTQSGKAARCKKCHYEVTNSDRVRKRINREQFYLSRLALGFKTCFKCSEEKNAASFTPHSNGVLRNECDVCLKEAKQIYYSKNKDRIRIDSNERYHLNIEEGRAKKRYYQKNMPQDVRDKMNIARRLRRQEINAKDPFIRTREIIRNRLSKTLKTREWRKINSFTKTIGVDQQTFKTHLEKLFAPGMAWNNYGYGHDKWNIDHIIPISSAKTIEEAYALCHYTNLQPLWQVDNFSKKATILPTQMKIAI